MNQDKHSAVKTTSLFLQYVYMHACMHVYRSMMEEHNMLYDLTMLVDSIDVLTWHVALFMHGCEMQSSVSDWHWSPKYPDGHVQWKPLTWSCEHNITVSHSWHMYQLTILFDTSTGWAYSAIPSILTQVWTAFIDVGFTPATTKPSNTEAGIAADTILNGSTREIQQ